MSISKEELMAAAISVMENAYAPFSKFQVGAALVSKDGRIFCGCNVENASYGLTICAERAAFFAAISADCREFSAIAIFCNGDHLPYPCGACRQVMAEFCGQDFNVYIASSKHSDVIESRKLGDLLPDAFTLIHQ